MSSGFFWRANGFALQQGNRLFHGTMIQLGILVLLYASSQFSFAFSGSNELTRVELSEGGSVGSASWDSELISETENLLWRSAEDGTILVQSDTSLPALKLPATSEYSSARKRGPNKKISAGLILALLVAALVPFYIAHTISGRALPVPLPISEVSTDMQWAETLYSGVFTQQRAQQMAKKKSAAFLLKLEEAAVELGKNLDSVDAREALRRLRRSVLLAKREEQYLKEEFIPDLKTSEANTIAMTAHTCASVDRLCRHFDNAVNEMYNLRVLAKQFVEEANKEVSFLVTIIENQEHAVNRLVSSMESIAPETESRNTIMAHNIYVEGLSSEAKKCLAEVQGVLTGQAATLSESPLSSLAQLSEAVERAFRIRQRMRAIAAESNEWTKAAEEATQEKTKNYVAYFLAQLPASRDQAKQPNSFKKSTAITDGHFYGIYDLCQQLRMEQRMIGRITTEREIVQSIKRIRALLKHAGRETLRPPTTPASSLGSLSEGNLLEQLKEEQSTEYKEKSILSGVWDESALTGNMRGKLLSFAKTAVDNVDNTSVGYEWFPMSGRMPELLRVFGMNEAYRSRQLKATWQSKIVESGILNTHLQLVLEKIQDAKDDSDLKHAVQNLDLVYLGAVQRASKAAELSHEGKAWDLLERAICACVVQYDRAISSDHAPSGEYLERNGLSDVAIFRAVYEAYTQESVVTATRLIVDVSKKVRALQEVVQRTSEAVKRVKREAFATALPQPDVTESREALLESAKLASELVSHARNQVILMTTASSEWVKIDKSLEVEQTVSSIQDARVAIEENAEKFKETLYNLNAATTDSERLEASLALIKAKEKVLDIARTAHFSYQETSLAIHQRIRFGQDASLLLGPKTKETRSLNWKAKAEAVLQTALNVKELHEQVAGLALQELAKKNAGDESVEATIERVHEDGEVLEGFVKHVQNLINACEKPNTDSDRLLEEAKSCITNMWISIFTADALVADMHNTQEINTIINQSLW